MSPPEVAMERSATAEIERESRSEQTQAHRSAPALAAFTLGAAPAVAVIAGAVIAAEIESLRIPALLVFLGCVAVMPMAHRAWTDAATAQRPTRRKSDSR